MSISNHQQSSEMDDSQYTGAGMETDLVARAYE